MKFDKLNDTVPYVIGGKEKVLSMSPYKGVTLRLPGRHAKDTTPKGGDFVVCVTDKTMGWVDHQFTHTDIFKDIELKCESEHLSFFINRYSDVVCGDDPDKINLGDGLTMPGIDFDTFLAASQCLAVAEHRRYSQYESKFGGRFLPLRFAAGISEGLWTAADAAAMQKKGRPGVEILEKLHGTPILTKDLMS